MSDDHFSLADIKQRGWTDSLVRKLLGVPDATRRNPHCASGPAMKLYSRERVLASEESEQWAALAARVERNRAGSRKAADIKAARLIAYVDGLDVRVPVLPMPDVVENACESYNDLQEAKALRGGSPDWRRATPESDVPFLQRLAVNYLRHEISHYEAELKQIFGHVGVDEAYVRLNRKVYAAIADAYPVLAGECERQAERKGTSAAIAQASAAPGKSSDPPP